MVNICLFGVHAWALKWAWALQQAWASRRALELAAGIENAPGEACDELKKINSIGCCQM